MNILIRKLNIRYSNQDTNDIIVGINSWSVFIMRKNIDTGSFYIDISTYQYDLNIPISTYINSIPPYILYKMGITQSRLTTCTNFLLVPIDKIDIYENILKSYSDVYIV